MIGSTLLDRYKIESELGKGGMGVVYKAHDTLLNRAVAIKFLNITGVGTQGKARLLQEARATAQVNHPNIVSVFDAGETEGNPFIVMEFVQGKTLRENETPPLLDALRMAGKICRALDHAHSKGIIHRDLKLENIVITDPQNLKLMDFGLARTADDVRLTEEGAIMGTLAYLAPELIQGQPASAQSDLYAFGVILYQLLVGHAPFQGTVNEVLSRHLQGTVTAPGEIDPQIPAWVDDLVLRLLSKRPEERPTSAGEVLLLLEQKTAAPATTDIYSISKPKSNLPAQLTSFIGREKETKEVIEAINQTRLVTLTGSGGTGKTRLSLQVAEKMLGAFKDGAWFIELAPLSDPALVINTVAKTLGVSEEPGRPLAATVADWLRDRELLLILDNCEHLIEACAQFTDTALRASRKTRILASSRESLGVAGELAWRVLPLATPDPKLALGGAEEGQVNIEDLEQYAAVRLFVERAKFANNTFIVNNKNIHAVAQICHRLDGIPLAIELAAARIKVLKAEQIAGRLDDRFRLLTGGIRTALPHQQTLRSLIDWSYDLLSESEKLLLRRLAIFMGGWTLEAAETVCSGEGIESGEVLDLLGRLVDKSLVVADHQAETSRYRMLETIRQYALEKLTGSGEMESTQNRHLDFYMKLAEEAEPELYRPSQLIWLNRLELDHDNLRAALEWSQSGGDANAGLRLATALWWFWNLLAYLREGYGWLERTLDRRHESITEAARARALYRAGQLAHYLGDEYAHRTSELWQESLELNKKLGGMVNCVHTLIFLAWIAKDIREIDALYGEALALARQTNNIWTASATLMNWSDSMIDRGNPAQAIIYLDESLLQFRKLGDRWGIAWSLLLLAHANISQKNDAPAEGFLEESLAFFRELGYKVGVRNVLISQANMALGRGDYDRAARLFKENLALAREMGIKRAIAAGLLSLGPVEYRRGRYPRAATLLAEGLISYREQGNMDRIPICLAELARVSAALEHPERAALLYGAAEAQGMALDSTEFKEYARDVEAVRAQLGEAIFEEKYAEGKPMTLDQAIAHAIEGAQYTVEVV